MSRQPAFRAQSWRQRRCRIGSPPRKRLRSVHVAQRLKGPRTFVLRPGAFRSYREHKALAIVGSHGEHAAAGGRVTTLRGTYARLIAAGTVTAALVLIPAAASAATGTGQEFGQHVVTCAQTMGFDGMHNPGMHQGFSGWDPAHRC